MLNSWKTQKKSIPVGLTFSKALKWLGSLVPEEMTQEKVPSMD